MNKSRKTWFPNMDQVFFKFGSEVPSGNYLNSVWVGLTAPFVNLPVLLFRFLLIPFLMGFFYIVGIFITCIFMGLSGNIVGYAYTKSEIESGKTPFKD